MNKEPNATEAHKPKYIPIEQRQPLVVLLDQYKTELAELLSQNGNVSKTIFLKVFYETIIEGIEADLKYSEDSDFMAVTTAM